MKSIGRTIFEIIRKRKTNYFSHIIRREGYNLLCQLLQRKLNDRRRIGKNKVNFMDEELKRMDDL